MLWTCNRMFVAPPIFHEYEILRHSRFHLILSSQFLVPANEDGSNETNAAQNLPITQMRIHCGDMFHAKDRIDGLWWHSYNNDMETWPFVGGSTQLKEATVHTTSPYQGRVHKFHHKDSLYNEGQPLNIAEASKGAPIMINSSRSVQI